MSRLRSLVRWAWSLSSLGAGAAGRAWMFTLVLLLPLKMRLFPCAAIPVRLRLGREKRWFWFRDSSELFALDEIFNGGEYAAVSGRHPETIVDLGANVGQAALWFRAQFPNARIFCVEPDPRTFATLTRNLGGDPLVTLRQFAVSASDGWVSLERTPNSSWGTRVADTDAPDATRVRAVSIDTLFDAHELDEVDLMKVDIEGQEHAALCSGRAGARAGLVVGELHGDLLGMPPEVAVEEMRRSGEFDASEVDGDIFVLSRHERGQERADAQV